MRDLSRPLEECLQAMQEKRNLQDILRRYPAERDELIGLLRLSGDNRGQDLQLKAAVRVQVDLKPGCAHDLGPASALGAQASLPSWSGDMQAGMPALPGPSLGG